MTKEERTDKHTESHRLEGRIGPIYGEQVSDTPASENADGQVNSGVFANMATGPRVISYEHSKYARMGDGFYFVASQLPEHAGFETPLLGEGFFDIHFCLRGSLRLVGDWGEVAFEGPRLLFWYHPPGHSDVVEQVRGGDQGYAGVSLYCDRKWLKTQALAGDETINTVWDEYSSQSPTAPQFRVLPLPGDSDFILRQILRTESDDSLNYLQLKGRAFELFAIAFHAHLDAQKDSQGTGFKASEIQKAAAVREILHSNYVQAPTIKELGLAVGLNSTRLMECFKYQYKETIRNTVLRLRMEEARRLLLTSDLPIGSVAYKVGYSHHSSFSTSFSDYFGISPKQIVASRAVMEKHEEKES